MVRVIARIRLAAHPLDRVGQRHALHRGVVQPDDQIAGANAGPLGGGVVNRRDHLEKAVFLPDLDAQAAEFAGGADLQILERLGVQIGGMRIEIAQHAANGVFQQILVLDRLDVILLDGVEYAGERAQLVQRQLVLRRRFLLGPDRMHRRQRNACQKAQRQRQTVSGCSTHLHSRNHFVIAARDKPGIFSPIPCVRQRDSARKLRGGWENYCESRRLRRKTPRAGFPAGAGERGRGRMDDRAYLALPWLATASISFLSSSGSAR